jgi:hypothetical protein
LQHGTTKSKIHIRHPRCRTGGDDKKVLRFGGNAATKPSEGIYKPIAIRVRALPVRDVRKRLYDVDVEAFGSKGDKDLQYKWISDVLNEYIENNRHILQRKPKAQHIVLEAPKVEAPDLQKIVKNMFVEVTANHKAVVFPKRICESLG